jgi:hypothetical protein
MGGEASEEPAAGEDGDFFALGGGQTGKRWGHAFECVDHRNCAHWIGECYAHHYSWIQKILVKIAVIQLA